MANTTLDEVVANAVEKEIGTSTESAQTETKTESKAEETKVEQKDQSSAEELAYREKVDKAVRLFDALSDPNIGRSVVEELARKAGIVGVEQGRSEKQITKSVTDVLKESLGAEYEFLADRLGPSIDQIVKQTVAEQIKPIQESNREALERTTAAEVNAVFKEFETTHKDVKEHESAMLELSKKLPYTGDYPMGEYLEHLYKVVTSDKKEAKVIKTTVDKINKNAQEIRDSSTEVQENRVSKGSKLPSLDEAIKAAWRGERLA